MVDKNKYPDGKDATYRIKRQVKKAVPSSPGLRDCLKSVSEKFPWSSSKLKFMLTVSFFVQVILGTTFYSLDVYTDVKFCLDMLHLAQKNFGKSYSECLLKFESSFDNAIYDCKNQFNKRACLATLAEVKRTSECFEDEQRFTEPTDWRIAGAVCAAHCLIPVIVALILWPLILVGQECEWSSWSKLPLAFSTKWHKFQLEKNLYNNYAWSNRNQSKETEKTYEETKKSCMELADAHENVVVLSLVIESSMEASFQVSS